MPKNSSKDIHVIKILIKRLCLCEIKHFRIHFFCIEKTEISDIYHETKEKFDIAWKIQTEQGHMHNKLQNVNHAPQELQS